MTLEELFTRWVSAERADDPAARDRLEQARHRALEAREAEMTWLIGALADRGRRYAAAMLFCMDALPTRLVPAYIAALREERDPSTVKFFVRPLLRTLGHARLLEELARLLPQCPPGEQANIVQSLYWLGFTVDIPRDVLAADQPPGPEEWARIVSEGTSPHPAAVEAVWERMHEAMLDAYADSADRDLRLVIGRRMSLDPARHPERLRPKVLRAREICLADPELRAHARL